MKTILIPTDYSGAAKNAAGYAVELAKFFKARLILFHAYHVPVPSTDVPVMVVSPEEIEKENMRLLEKQRQEILAGSGLEVQCIARAGFPAEEILNVIEEWGADLVVTGITGAGRVAQALMGSTATALIRRAPVPVLVVPAKAAFSPAGKVVFACDYYPVKDAAVVSEIREVMKAFQPGLMVLNVVRPGETASVDKALAGVRMESYLGDIPHTLYFPEAEDEVSEINRFVKEKKAGLLVMIPRRHTFFGRMLGESNTKRVAFTTEVPLLAIPDRTV